MERAHAAKMKPCQCEHKPKKGAKTRGVYRLLCRKSIFLTSNRKCLWADIYNPAASGWEDLQCYSQKEPDVNLSKYQYVAPEEPLRRYLNRD